MLARGDRRGFDAVDGVGKTWSLSRRCGVKPEDMRARLGLENKLPSVDVVQIQLPDILKRPSDLGIPFLRLGA